MPNLNPNLSGLNLPAPLLDAIRLAFQEIQSAQESSSAALQVIQDTHTNRNILHGARTVTVGSLYYETDRTVLYICRLVTQANTWVWLDGVMYGLLAARPSDLGTNDTGFVYSSSDALDYRWSGSAWVVLDTVRGGTGLTHVGRVTKVTATGVTGESSITDNGVTVTIPEPVSVDMGATPQQSQIQLRANSPADYGALEMYSYGADDQEILFDLHRTTAGFIAQNATVGKLMKVAGKLLMRGIGGLTPGAVAPTLPIYFEVNLATGDVNVVSGNLKFGGTAVVHQTEAAGTVLAGPLAGSPALPSFKSAASVFGSMIVRAAFASAPTPGAGDAGLLWIVSDVAHILYWTGSGWELVDACGNYIAGHAGVPDGAGWQLCDGSATSYLHVTGGTASLVSFTTPNLVGASPEAFAKWVASYTGAVDAAIAPTWSTAASGVTGAARVLTINADGKPTGFGMIPYFRR